MSLLFALPSSPIASVFDTLELQQPDALLALIGLHRRDPRPGKIDLGVGVFRDEAGGTPVMAAIKAAEARLLADQDTKAYLGAEGNVRFTELLADVALGGDLAADPRVTGVQTPGGTGALRLGAELLARARPGATVWIGAPTWPNHSGIFREAGLAIRSHAFFDITRSTIDFYAMLVALAEAARGDVLLLHGCCHNPSGAQFSPEQWAALAKFCNERGLIPFIDIAYQGLGSGLEEDAAGMRLVLNANPDALVAYSCDKNFALYRERVGALWVLSASIPATTAVRDNMLVLARMLWSMPPDHGAASVRIILDDPKLTAAWKAELGDMRARLNQLRALLGAAHPALAPIARQQGLFALLPIDRTAVHALRNTHGIYMADSARINVAGLRTDTIPVLMAALSPYLPSA
jgi:aromatic-amino-acid transaminase